MKLFIAICLSIFILSCGTKQNTEDDLDPAVDAGNAKPNIVFIIADDMGLDASPGYEMGSIKPNMPNLQSMINSGIVFNNVWSNPTCTPTRAGLLTGKYGFRTGVTKVGDVLSTSEQSIQEYLDEKTASTYSHTVIGKWHVSNSETSPNDMGINYFAGILRGTVPSYYDWDLTINGTTAASTTYVTTELTDLAIDWVGQQTKPWFLWLAYNAPHAPFHLPPAGLHSQGALPSDQASIDANPLPYYMAMLEAMDSEYGRFLNSLSEEERANTIFIFIGDNGTPRNVIQEYAASRAKETIYQGGINIPMVVSGKNVSRINTSENALINTTDLFATIAAIAGVDITEINDSKSFKELLTNANGAKRDYAFSEIGTDNGGVQRTIRNATHKYLIFETGVEAFYNLMEDPLEEIDLLANGENSLSNTDALQLSSLKEELNVLLN